MYASGLIMWIRIEFIAEGGDLNPWVKGLRPLAIAGLCHLSIPLSSVKCYVPLPFLFVFSGWGWGLLLVWAPLLRSFRTGKEQVS